MVETSKKVCLPNYLAVLLLSLSLTQSFYICAVVDCATDGNGEMDSQGRPRVNVFFEIDEADFVLLNQSLANT